MKKLRLIVASILAICLHASVSAEGQVLGTLTETNNSVTKVMMKAGCDLGWLSQIVAESRIDPNRLRALPVGQELTFSGSCKNAPSKEVASYSAILLKLDANSRVSEDFKSEIASLRKAQEAKVLEFEGVVRENGRLELLVQSLKDKLAKSEASVKEVIVQGFTLANLLSTFLLGVTLTAFTAYFLSHRTGSGKISFLSEWTLKDNGEVHSFAFVGAEEAIKGSGDFVGKYKCPLCTEKNLTGRERNLRAHIREKHADTRMHVDTSEDFVSEVPSA